ncbi:hypothetical protein [Methylobacterium sp. WL7]|uniref:hypothetical protein n=1 Tax=Methylobacterium sp. WL7 TaxID=2603900 RepID=UPI0011C7401D|nr:hypothetical protein [Methylobacterium sp. WL7]TXN46571.1 hypothetical protein FV233_07585 [Methylobacterium sp. WL7]
MADWPKDLDRTTHDQVTNLLGAMHARPLLLMLRGLAADLAGNTDGSLVGPDGLASIHRLKSEAGLMGFARLSAACGAFDDVHAGHGPAGSAIPELRSAIASALLIMDDLTGPADLGQASR